MRTGGSGVSRRATSIGSPNEQPLTPQASADVVTLETQPDPQPPKTYTATDGLYLLQTARRKRQTADQLAQKYPTDAAELRAEADDAERLAETIFALPDQPEVGTGGELQLGEEAAYDLPGLVNTVKNPSLVTVEASRTRLDLASEADCLSLALDAAETIQADNSLEKMLAHEMAAAHAMAMRFAAKADNMLGHVRSFHSPERQQLQSI